MVQSTLVDIEIPLGETAVPSAERASLDRERAMAGQRLVYEQGFISNGQGQVVADRATNVLRLTSAYTGSDSVISDVEWNVDDPNVMRLTLAGGARVFTRVTSRFEDEPEARRIDTSEVIEQVIDNARTVDGAPTVRKSRTVTKYKWRDAPAGEAVIVATQIVSDFLTSYDGVQSVLAGGNTPYRVSRYKLAFIRPSTD